MCEFASAIFGAAGQRPAVGAIGGAGADREEVLGQRTAGAEETARCDGLVNIDNIARANAADRAIAVDRHIDRPVLAELQRLREAIGGKAARTIFADVLLVRRREQPRPRPGREVETEPRGTRLDRIARPTTRRVGTKCVST